MTQAARDDVPVSPHAWPSGIRALATTRAMPGYSLGPHARCNLGAACGDDPDAVSRNRASLAHALDLPSTPRWLEQVHGTAVHDADVDPVGSLRADASFTREPGRVLAVLTADCLPIVLASEDASVVAAVHAGWRGLRDGVVEACVGRLAVPASRLLAWIGPAICASHYEVGADVRDAFRELDAGADAAFAPTRAGHWSCDLPALARRRLARLGIERVTGGEHCTHCDGARFYSYRRDGITGRIATLAWLGR